MSTKQQDIDLKKSLNMYLRGIYIYMNIEYARPETASVIQEFV